MKKIIAASLILFAGTVICSAGEGNLIGKAAEFTPAASPVNKMYNIARWEIRGMDYSCATDSDGKKYIEGKFTGAKQRWFKTVINNPGKGKFVFSARIWTGKPLKQITLFRYSQGPDKKPVYQSKNFYGRDLPAMNSWKTLMTTLDFPEDTKRFNLIIQLRGDENTTVRMAEPALRKLEE